MSEPNPYESSNVVPFKGTLGDNTPKPPLKSGGGDGTSSDMTERVANLEKRFDRFETKLDAVVKDLAEVKGRVNAMPTSWQLLGMILAILGAAFAIIRFGLAH